MNTCVTFLLLAFGVEPFLGLSPERLPERLSETGAFRSLTPLRASAALTPYEIRVSFYADDANKRRWLAVPDGKHIRFAAQGEWQFPRGTTLVKHFERCGQPIETRLLFVLDRGNVSGAAYRWKDGREAELVRDSQTAALADGRPWFFPGVDDCRKCHTPVAGGVLGVNARQWKDLDKLIKRGSFETPPTRAELKAIQTLPALDDDHVAIETRARSWLDVNCAYCHRPGGVAADFDARFETPLAKQSLVDAPARINFGLDRARLVAPRDPWRSVLLVRCQTLEATKMPSLAHETRDEQGIELLKAWIASLPGADVVAPPRIDPPGGDFHRPITVTLRHDDASAEIRYTLDGSPPTEASPLYTAPLQLTSSTTLRARAFQRKHTRSIAVHETYIFVR
jgi:hypothetical protein